MKRLLCTLCVFSLGFLAYGQEKTLYLDLCENVVSADHYSIRRVITEVPGNKFAWTFIDYYKDGTEFTSGSTKARNGKTKDGKFVFYYPTQQRLANGEYFKGVRDSTWIYYDKSGAEVTGEELIPTLPVVRYIADSMEYKGRCLCYSKKGLWIEKNLRTQAIVTREYEGGEAIAENGIYLVVDKSATYNQGMEAFYEKLRRKLSYPFLTRLNSIHGQVYVKFAIDQHGDVIDIKFLNELDEPTSRSIEHAIMSTTGNWVPAVLRGRNVGSWLILPVIYKLK